MLSASSGSLYLLCHHVSGYSYDIVLNHLKLHSKYKFRVQRAPETCRANAEKNKEYNVHLVGPELNIHITKMYGTTNIKFTL
jgi:hypothetical protein